jgi:hypothetical protein
VEPKVWVLKKRGTERFMVRIVVYTCAGQPRVPMDAQGGYYRKKRKAVDAGFVLMRAVLRELGGDPLHNGRCRGTGVEVEPSCLCCTVAALVCFAAEAQQNKHRCVFAKVMERSMAAAAKRKRNHDAAERAGGSGGSGGSGSGGSVGSGSGGVDMPPGAQSESSGYMAKLARLHIKSGHPGRRGAGIEEAVMTNARATQPVVRCARLECGRVHLVFDYVGL